MSTSSHGYFSSSANQLPVPKLKLATNDHLGNYGFVNIEWVDKATHLTGGTFRLFNYPLIVANDLDQEFLNENAVYVEMLHYRRGRSASGTTYTNADGSGYVTPSSWTSGINSLDGRWTRGGFHTSNISASGFMPQRPNHYQITAPNQVVPVWQYLHNRFTRSNVSYRDTSGNVQTITATVPLNGLNKYANTPTRRFGYSSRYTPYYSTFRYIFVDLTTGNFVSGPTTKIMKIVSPAHPFELDPISSALNGFPSVSISPSYSIDIMKAYIETKLP